MPTSSLSHPLALMTAGFVRQKRADPQSLLAFYQKQYLWLIRRLHPDGKWANPIAFQAAKDAYDPLKTMTPDQLQDLIDGYLKMHRYEEEVRHCRRQAEAALNAATSQCERVINILCESLLF